MRDQGRPPTNYLLVGGTEFSDPTLLEGWALYFESLAMPSSDSAFDDIFKSSVLVEFEELCCLPYCPLEEFSLSDVQEVVSFTPFHKSPGPDGVSVEHLHYESYAFVSSLTVLCYWPYSCFLYLWAYM